MEQTTATPALSRGSDGRIGQPVRRLEDERLTRGQGRYVDDIALADMLHAAVVRSPHAHAAVVAVETQEAAAMEGVTLILTAAEMEAAGINRLPLDLPPPGHAVEDFAAFEQPILAGRDVRYLGQPVAFVVATTRETARDAAEAVVVDYEDQPATVETDKGTEFFSYEEGDEEETARHFAEAARTVGIEIRNNRVHALPLEPRGAVGIYEPETGSFCLQVSTQRVHIIQRALADRVFRVPREQMRVVAPETGGGFGQKNGLYPEYVLCLEAARRLGRPVKWISSRAESLAADNHGRDNFFRAEAALDGDGRMLAIRAHRIMNMGAYAAPRAMVPVSNGLTHLSGVYGVKAAHVRVSGVLTHTSPTSPYRGAGRPENVFCCERLIDVIARRLGHDPVALRRLNLVAHSAMPWTSPLGTRFEDLDIARLLDDVLERLDYTGFAERRKAIARAGKLAGFGVALFAEDLHGSQEPITVRLSHQQGKLTLFTGTGSAGHGHETSFLQIVSERLGLPMERLAFVQSDTQAVPDGIGTAASWSLTLGGSSAHVAAEAAIQKGAAVAASLLDSPPEAIDFDHGQFRRRGTNFAIDWNEVFAAEPDFTATGTFGGSGQTVSIGCHACEVEVDPQTGAVSIRGYAAAQDCGRAVNPMLVTGQLHGGVAQGIGQGWIEHVVYDTESGQLVSGELTDYALPRATDLPVISTALHAMGTPDNPLGVKGIGESAATGSTPTFVNAVLDALAPYGIEHIEPPLTPMAVWQALREAGWQAGKSGE